MIKTEKTAEGLLIIAEGRLDSSTSEAFRKAVFEEIAEEAKPIVIDLAAVTFISSAGLRAFFMIALDQGRNVRLCSLRPEIRPVFAASGFDRILTIFESREQALAVSSA